MTSNLPPGTAFPPSPWRASSLRAVIVPELGAKIVSLFDRRRQHEWLVPPMRTLKQTAYGDDFVSQDMSGWDEMMPTIVACDYQGARLPDHGEVWSIPWQVERLRQQAGRDGSRAGAALRIQPHPRAHRAGLPGAALPRAKHRHGGFPLPVGGAPAVRRRRADPPDPAARGDRRWST